MSKKLSSKDKSLILLVISSLIVLWALYSVVSYLFFTSTFKISDANKLIIQDGSKQQQWVNTSRPLDLNDLKDRVILLDFWTYACVNCINILPEIKKLEKEYGNKLTVIGVHSGKFENEKQFPSIVKAVLKHDITHPVVDDSDQKIWNNFGVNAWPTLVLINPHGNVEEIYVGEDEAKKMPKDVKKLISKYKYQINREELPIVLEKNKVAQHVLHYPTKIAYSAYFPYKAHNAPVLFIANTGKNNILAVSLTGEIIAQIGSGREDFEDGAFDNASFNAPQGLLYKDEKLYVADSGNHALREINFREEKVTTLVGSGRRGSIISATLNAADAQLSSPTDIEFYPDSGKIAIANSGSHQILQYDLAKQMISVLAGSGVEGIADGANPQNSLAQTSDLAVYDGKLYFIDAESSALRVLGKDGNVKTLLGKGLFDFGHQNGKKDVALMQHPLGLMIDDTGIYIADSFNHRIRKYGLSGGEIHDLIGAQKGSGLGATAKTEFDEPEGIISVHDRFYVADTNNNRIVIVNRGKLNSELLDVMPQLKLPKEGFLEYLPNLHHGPDITVASDKEIALAIDFKKGWKINDLGPSFINLLEIVSEDEANLLASFDWNMIKNDKLHLPKLLEGKNYVLQATIYYCEARKNALCHISSYERKIKAQNGEKNNKIEVELFYQ